MYELATCAVEARKLFDGVLYMLNKLIISAPFGNYFRRPGITSTLGTFTTSKRAGTLLRLWRVLSTVRYYWRQQSWINKLGLPNPGIDTLVHCTPCAQDIVSVYGFDESQWSRLVHTSKVFGAVAVELNLSCPNLESKTSINTLIDQVKLSLSNLGIPKIAKLPPLRWMDFGGPLYDLGIRCFHLCNTIPTPGGGISGKPLMQYSLWAVEEFRKRFGDSVTLIGGGGITDLTDVKAYVSAGADHVSVGSMLFNPFNWKKLDLFREYLS